jgi:hypothetical protein
MLVKIETYFDGDNWYGIGEGAGRGRINKTKLRHTP